MADYDKNTDTPSKQASAARRPYEAPVLRTFGALSQITKGAGGSKGDGGTFTRLQ